MYIAATWFLNTLGKIHQLLTLIDFYLVLHGTIYYQKIGTVIDTKD